MINQFNHYYDRRLWDNERDLLLNILSGLLSAVERHFVLSAVEGHVHLSGVEEKLCGNKRRCSGPLMAIIICALRIPLGRQA